MEFPSLSIGEVTSGNSFKALVRKFFLWISILLACVASVSVWLGSKERPRNGILPARNWGESQNKKEGEGEKKDGNACRQTPGF